MTPEDIASHFTHADGEFLFARWARPLAPVAFGVTDDTLPVVKGALEAIAAVTGQSIAETDPDIGANVMMFFFRDWRELSEVPNLDRLIPDLPGVVERLEAAGANQYRTFRFDEDGAIRACFVFLRMDDELSALPADELALNQAVQLMLLWSNSAFTERSPLLRLPEGATILRPDTGHLLRAAYDPVIPPMSRDPALAYRLHARLQAAD